MKRKILLMAAIVLCLSISAYGTLAFFVADAPTHNIITSGGVDIEIVEKDANGHDFNRNQLGVMPSQTIAKIVTVENKGETKAWVRVKLEKQIDLDKKAKEKYPNATVDTGLMQLNLAENDKWTPGNDGYYYYNDPLDAKASTEPLLNSVTFSAAMGNEYQSAKAYVNITAEAVQWDNNPDGIWPKAVLPLDPKDSNPVPPVTGEPDTDPEPEPEPDAGSDGSDGSDE